MSSEKRIPESDWTWLGYPQHYICADSCRFRMATIVGNVVVSTVGDYHVRTRDGVQMREPTTIGCGERDFYETFVFRVEGMESCGCCPRLLSLSEIWGRRSPDAVAAQRMHMETCRKFADEQPTGEVEP